MAGVSLGKRLVTELGSSLGITVTLLGSQTPSEIFLTSWRRAWFRGDQGVTASSNRVSAWANIWGAGDFAQATGAAQPLRIAGTFLGQDCLSNDDGARSMLGTLTTTIAAGSRMYMWCFLRVGAAALSGVAAGVSGAAGAGPYLKASTSGSGAVRWRLLISDGVRVEAANTVDSIDTGVCHLLEIGLLAQPNRRCFALSGFATEGARTDFVATGGTASLLSLFCNGVVGLNSMQCDIAELVIVRGEPSQQQLAAMRAYFAQRYGAI